MHPTLCTLALGLLAALAPCVVRAAPASVGGRGARQAAPVPTITGGGGGSAYMLDSNSDEFDGLGPPSPKWQTSFGGWPGTAPAYFSDTSAGVDGGSLVLKHESGQPVPEDLAGCDCGFDNVSTGMAVSAKAFTYGFFEIEANIPATSFLSAFWLQGNSGEINVFDTNTDAGHTCFAEGADQATTKGPLARGDGGLPVAFDPAAGFHVYGLAWHPEGVKFYVDGALVRSLDTATGDAACLGQEMNVFLTVEATEQTGPAAATPPGGSAAATINYFRRWYRPADYAATGANGVSTIALSVETTNVFAADKGGAPATNAIAETDTNGNSNTVTDANGNSDTNTNDSADANTDAGAEADAAGAGMQDTGAAGAGAGAGSSSSDSSSVGTVVVAAIAVALVVAILVVAGVYHASKKGRGGAASGHSGRGLSPSSSRASSGRSLTSLRKVRVSPAPAGSYGGDGDYAAPPPTVEATVLPPPQYAVASAATAAGGLGYPGAEGRSYSPNNAAGAFEARASQRVAGEHGRTNVAASLGGLGRLSQIETA